MLGRLKLVGTAEEKAAPSTVWDQIEVSQLQERVGKFAAEINEAAGYHLLETLYFLPPQKIVLRVRFDRNRAKHNMEITVRNNEVRLLFSTSKRSTFGWERYFLGDSPSSSTLIWQQTLHPMEILDENIQGWLTYLLSELSKEFRPDSYAAPSSAAESDLAAILRKASA